MKWLIRVGVASCVAFGLIANLANAGQPKKRDLEARIAYLEEALLERDSVAVLPILPPSPDSPALTCLVGTIALCHRPNGTIVPFCSGDTNSCSLEPSPEVCPDLCEAQGDIVVVDYDKDPCDAALAGQPYAFVCMTPNEYAARPDCPTSFVPHYRSDSDSNTGWVCDPSFGNEHLSRSVFEALLFESTRTNFLFNEIVNNLGGAEVFDPVAGGK